MREGGGSRFVSMLHANKLVTPIDIKKYLLPYLPMHVAPTKTHPSCHKYKGVKSPRTETHKLVCVCVCVCLCVCVCGTHKNTSFLLRV